MIDNLLIFELLSSLIAEHLEFENVAIYLKIKVNTF